MAIRLSNHVIAVRNYRQTAEVNIDEGSCDGRLAHILVRRLFAGDLENSLLKPRRDKESRPCAQGLYLWLY